MVIATTAPANVNVEAWLDTVAGTHPSVVIPYVKSSADGDVRYALTVKKSGPTGRSNIHQSGNVAVQAGKPAALSRFSVSVGPSDACNIKLMVSANQQAANTYHFECPR
jgi:curli production protein